MSDIKYEPVFGDQSLFEGVSDDTVMVIRQPGDNMPWCFKSFDEGFEYVSQGDRNPEVAMRRIIKTPVWTVADQKAGRLPEVGSIFTYKDEILTCHFIDGDGEIWAHDIDNKIVTPLLRDCKPIETPEERAQRLRDEWKNNVIEIHHGKRRKMSTSTFLLDDIYDALLSGELQAPKGE